MMNVRQLWLAVLLCALVVSDALAVSLSRDGAGQVLIFPAFAVSLTRQAEILVRNTTAQGKAVRVVVKDLIQGRPMASINVYLKAHDSWVGRILENPSGQFFRSRQADLDWQDDSCTFPARDDLPATGIRLSTAELGSASLTNLVTPLLNGYVEVYELGQIDSDLAADCDAIAERWASAPWALPDGRNDDVAAQGGGLRGLEIIKDTKDGRSFQFDPIVLADFRDSPLHSAPQSRRPNLADVRPAQSTVLRTIELNGRRVIVERVSNWSEHPIQAVDAVLMTERLETEYWSERDTGAFASVVLGMPTRPYHTDAEGYYLGDQERVLAPFAADLQRSDNTTDDSDILVADTFGGQGRPWDLNQPGGSTRCDSAEAAMTWVQLYNFITFSHSCREGHIEFILPNQHTRGRIGLQFAAELESDEGDIYRGWPAHGYLVQDVVSGFAQRPVGVFARSMDRIAPEVEVIVDIQP